ncbi:hypothetical protein EUGRSUZ_F02042 [Eucalyptus grandis]|uniref:HECT-type E3 ubiquitin transferase n=2 Tax=Eucalyptus grandis TaxID=71139 RepID=A0A059BQT1_EUCGR|nr:hypothetical protein EUGRSUZ_F02042 [Eucalyptus grandis]
MREAGFIATLLPLLNDTDPQHLHLVCTAVHILEAFMDYSNPAAALFRELGGLDDTIKRLEMEVSYVENGSKQQGEKAECSASADVVAAASSDLDNIQPLYSESLVSHHRRLLMKALLRAISLGTYAPGNTTSINGSTERLLPHCLCVIFQRAKDFGGGVFSLAATVMSDLIHKDPTCFSILEAAGLPSAFLDAILDGAICSAEAISCVPQCLDALCLNNNGLQAVKDRNALRCFVKIFTSRGYLRWLTGDTPGNLSSGLDELLRHASSLRGPGVDMLIEILNVISNIGSGVESSNSTIESACSSSAVPMETDAEGGSFVSPDDKDSAKMDVLEHNLEPSPDASGLNAEAFLPDFASNAARLLETVLQNAETCRLFVEKKGIEAVLRLLTLPLMPMSASLGHSLSVAFKNFSLQHSASLARAVCAFIREHLKEAIDLLMSVGDTPFAAIESTRQATVLRHLFILEGILSLSNFLLKGTTTLFSELGTSDADILKGIGRAYREIIWQISLISDSKGEEKRNLEQEPESSDAGSSSAVGRESDDDANIPVVRYMNPVSVRNSSHSLWGGEREFLSIVRSSEGLHRRTRHGFTRLRGGRTGRHLEALNIDSEAYSNAPDTSSLELKKKSPDVLMIEILGKLASTMRSFFTALVKGFTSSNRRRGDSGALGTASKTLGSALAKVFHEALNFSGHSTSEGPSVKCRYLGKVVDDMAAVTFDSKRRTCYAAMVNSFYVHETFKELLTTFEATSQLLWTLPYSMRTSGDDHDKLVEETKQSGRIFLDTLQSYCRELEYFVNPAFLLSPSASQAQLLVQPATTGLSIGLFPVPRDPEVFVKMLQSQVLDVILPIWNHQLFPNCSPGFIASIVSLVMHVYSGTGDLRRNRSGAVGSTNQRYVPPPPDEATITTIVEMGFTRARAEEALRRVETNSVEMAMEWLFSHAEDPVQEDDELARALALSLGSSSETSKIDVADKSMDVETDGGQTKAPPVDDILSASVKLFQNGDIMAFTLTDLFSTLCNRNKGEDRSKVVVYLIQQLKLSGHMLRDINALCIISRVMALLLLEDGSAREIAAQEGIVSVAIDILMNFKSKSEWGDETLFQKCISALLLILDNMLQSRPKVSSENTGVAMRSLPDSSADQASLPTTNPITENKEAPDVCDKESGTAMEKIFGNPTGHLTIEESHKLLEVACDFIKDHVPAMIMQAVLQLCARLTKSHTLALQFLDNGALPALFSLPKACFFPGYDTVASAIIRHLLEDPQTLQSAMELEIRQTVSGNRHAGRLSPRTFLTSMAPVISRDPAIFMRAATAVCQVESSGGRNFVVLSKEKEKPKTSSEHSLHLTETGRATESKVLEGSAKCSKVHKKVPANLTQVIDQLIDIVLKFPSTKGQEECGNCSSPMEVDEPITKVKGKSKVGDNKKNELEFDRSAGLAKVTFVLKLMSDILLMYAHAVGVILKRDLEMAQLQVSSNPYSSGILHHILHHLLPLSANKSLGPDEWRDKLSEKASWFLVVLCGRSGEGRRRVICELVKTLSSFSNLESNSARTVLLPDKKVFSFVELAYSVLSKNSSPGTLPGSGCSPDIAKSMIDGGMVQCLTGILQVIDLDHPDAPKTVNLIVKSLESLTRAANMNEPVIKPDGSNKKKFVGSIDRVNEHINATSAVETAEQSQSRFNQEEVADAAETQEPQLRGSSQIDASRDVNPERLMGQNRVDEAEETLASSPAANLEMEFMREEMEEGGSSHNTNHLEVTFGVENRADDDMGDEDDMGDDGEDDDDDDDGEDEDEAEDGTGMMSLADTDVEDHDDAGLGDDYNDEMIDEEDDDFHENRVIEVRWREALDGLDDHLQVLGQPGATSGLIDVAAEPFEGVNVDDLFGLRRSLGFERRRQTGRSSFERSTTETSGFQHPLLLRPNQAGDMVSMWSGGNSSRDLESLTSESFDASHFYMFDAPVLPYDHLPSSLFSNRLGGSAPPPLSDYSINLDSLQLPGRRGPGDGRWTDDGQPQIGSQASAIAQAIEEQFLSHFHQSIPASSPAERQLENSEVQEKEQQDAPPSSSIQPALEVNNSIGQPVEDQQQEGCNEAENQENIRAVESVPLEEQVNSELVAEEPMSIQPLSLNYTPSQQDSMEIGDRNGATGQEGETVQELIISSTESVDQVSANVLADGGAMAAHSTGGSSVVGQANNHVIVHPNIDMASDADASSALPNADIDMNSLDAEENQIEQSVPVPEPGENGPSAMQATVVAQNGSHTDQTALDGDVPGGNVIDPTFLEALPEELRAEVLASQQAQSVEPPTYVPPSADEIDPEFLAALPPDIQAEVLAQQRAQRSAQLAQPVDMDNASIIATFPADLREEVLLTSSEAVLSALPSPLLAEAHMLRDRAMSHYSARSLFGSSHRLSNRRNGLGFDRPSMDRGVGVTIGRRASSTISDSLKMKEYEGEPLLDTNALKALIRLLRLAQPLGKGLLQRLLLNLCAHSITRSSLVHLLLNIIKPEAEGSESELAKINSQRLYGCQSNIVYGRSQLLDGLPPLVLRRILEILTFLARNHPAVASMLFYFDFSLLRELSSPSHADAKSHKGKEKIVEGGVSSDGFQIQDGDVPLVLFLKLLNRSMFSRGTTHFEQVLGLLKEIVDNPALKLESQSGSEEAINEPQPAEQSEQGQNEKPSLEPELHKECENSNLNLSSSNGRRSISIYDVFLQLPHSDLCNLCCLLGHEGLSDKVYVLSGEVLKKLALVAAPIRKLFISELSNLAHELSGSAVRELSTLRTTHMLGFSAGSIAGAAILRVLQALSALTSSSVDGNSSVDVSVEQEEQPMMWKLNLALESLWQELSDCISMTETQLCQNSLSHMNIVEHVQGTTPGSPLPPGTQRLLPYIEAFFVLCEKLQASNSVTQQDHVSNSTNEIKKSPGRSTSVIAEGDGDSHKRLDGTVTFAKFAEKHRRLLNAFIRQNPGLLENSLSMMLKAPRLVDFDNKRAYFRSRIRQQHEQHLSGPLRISVRRAYVLEDSYNQLRMRPTQELKGRLNVQFQGEEGIDAGGLTREWYQLLSRVIFDRGALLFTTVGNNTTFQPNPNSVYQTEHLSYFKFVGRVVRNFVGQLPLTAYFFNFCFQ